MDDTNTMSIHELKAIIACDHSDGYLKQWAEEQIDELLFLDFIAPSAKTLVTV